MSWTATLCYFRFVMTDKLCDIFLTALSKNPVFPVFGRRAGALDVDLMSNQPEEMTLLSSSAQGLDERKYGQCSRAAPHL